MIRTTLDEYLEFSKKFNYIPVWTEIVADMFTPVSVYQAIRDISSHSFLLESVQQNENLGRYSFIGYDPLMVFESYDKKIQFFDEKGNPVNIKSGNPFHELFELMERYKPMPVPELEPYSGGATGYFGYDCIRHVKTSQIKTKMTSASRKVSL